MSDPMTRLNEALEGRYIIEREIGEGGMATVYLADDLKHGRKIALKVLKPELTAVVGAERFLAEIKTTANLQHPHIVPLFDSGEADGFLFYVMPYMDGESLRERLERDHQLPVDEAVKIATDLAEALDYAHRQKVVHRDIKPANIMMHEGRPLIADFGIALAVGAAGGGRLTETGLSMGTPYYMSPEQATGDLSVGPATDIYALGAVLHELLTGDPPYTGSTAQAVLGQIIMGEAVSATKKRSSIPANVDAAVRKALEKLPADRFTSAQDFVRALADPHFRYGELAEAGVDVEAVGPWNRLTLLGWSLAAVASLAFGWSALQPEPAVRVERFQPLQNFAAGQPANLLPDGSGMVFRQVDVGGQRLWLRRWDDLNPVLIPGTEGVVAQHGPVPSPDGEHVAFVRDGSQLLVAPLLGGVVTTLTDDAICCQRWGSDGFIYYRSAAGNINRVPAAGGDVESVTQRDGGYEDPHGDFQVLPDSDLGVFMAFGPNPAPRIVAQRLSTGERKVLAPGMKPFVTPEGYLLFASLEGQIMAATFDAGEMELTSQPTPVAEGIIINSSPYPLYTVSPSGELLYQSGSAIFGTEFVWVTRSGEATPVDPGWIFNSGTNVAWSLSPDGTRLAVRAIVDGTIDIWIKELDAGPFSRLTFDGSAWSPHWTPDGEAVTFTSALGGDRDVWIKRADGTGEAELLHDNETLVIEGFLGPDGEWLMLRSGLTGARDIHVLRLGADAEELPLLTDEYNETQPALSPDGRWLAYTSDETGSNEVYVRPFPEVNTGKWQVSTQGGIMPVWARSGRELFFMDSNRDLIAAEFNADASGAPVGVSEALFTLPAGYSTSSSNTVYSVTPDDQGFLMARAYQGSDGEAVLSELVLVQNFFEVLRERVGN